MVGNKRSGTSQLVRVLNLHPQVFISHESDIAWILFRFHNHQPFRPHAWDSDRGMRLTLATAGHLLRHDAGPHENFVAAQKLVMETGTPWLAPQQKTDLRWIGDKKPMQHTDPAVREFLSRHFPEAHFLHIVRHPFEVVASSERFNQTPDGDFWLGLSPEEKMERWAFHEQEVLKLRAALPGRVHSLRYEDFCSDTRGTLTGILDFLQLKPDPQMLLKAARQTWPRFHNAPAIRCSAEAQRVAEAHGYELRRRASRWKFLAHRAGWQMNKLFSR